MIQLPQMLPKGKRINGVSQGIYWLLILLISAVVLYLFLFVSNISSFEGGSFEAAITGTGHRPYVYRTLLPTLTRIFAPVVPSRLIPEILENHLLAAAIARFSVPSYPAHALLALIGLYGALLGFVISLRMLMRRVGYSSWARNWLPVACLLVLPVFFPDGKLYDLPGLFLFTLCLALLVTRNWIGYLFVFSLASINKETAIILSVVFAVHFYGRISSKNFTALLGAQLSLWLAIRILIVWSYRSNPGALVEVHFLKQINSMVSNPLAVIVPGSILVVLIAHRWKEKPLFLRNSLIAMLPLGLLFIVLGMPYEIRVFLEVLPMLMLLVAGAVITSEFLYSEHPRAGIGHTTVEANLLKVEIPRSQWIRNSHGSRIDENEN